MVDPRRQTRHARGRARAPGRPRHAPLFGDHDALARGEPVDLTTYGGPNRSSAPSASDIVAAPGLPAAGIPYRSHRSSPIPCGPRAGRPGSRVRIRDVPPPRAGRRGRRRADPRAHDRELDASSRSTSETRPSTSSAATSKHVATRAIPAFPGAARTRSTVGSRASRHASACSRPPAPTTRTLIARTWRDKDRPAVMRSRDARGQALFATRTDRDHADLYPDELVDPLKILAGCSGEIAERGGRADLVVPSLEPS